MKALRYFRSEPTEKLRDYLRLSVLYPTAGDEPDPDFPPVPDMDAKVRAEIALREEEERAAQQLAEQPSTVEPAEVVG